ncbi:MAG: WYL domain-containing protein [Bacteroidota bacterium]
MPTTRDRLLDLLATRPGLAQHEVADRLGVATRTARRHLTALQAEGTVLAIPDGPASRYRLADGAHPATPVPRLTDDEAQALAVAALAARPLLAPTPLLPALDAAAAKLRASSVADVLSFEPEADDAHWSFDGAAGGVSSVLDPSVFRALLDAARGGHAVRADYVTASRQALGQGRTLAPLALLVRHGSWMAACRDLDADGHPVKDFALAGFRAATPLPDRRAEPPPGWSPQTHAADRLGALDGDPEEVRLLVSPPAAPYFRRKEYARTQIVEAEHPDGALTVSFETAGLEDARAFVMGWGALVRVLGPPALAEAVASSHRAAADLYADS